MINPEEYIRALAEVKASKDMAEYYKALSESYKEIADHYAQRIAEISEKENSQHFKDN